MVILLHSALLHMFLFAHDAPSPSWPLHSASRPSHSTPGLYTQPFSFCGQDSFSVPVSKQSPWQSLGIERRRGLLDGSPVTLFPR